MPSKKQNIKVKIVSLDNEYGVEFGFDRQSFTLNYRGTKQEAKWMTGQLKKMFKNFRGEKIV